VKLLQDGREPPRMHWDYLDPPPPGQSFAASHNLPPVSPRAALFSFPLGFPPCVPAWDEEDDGIKPR
jgi:hypothetical protein